MFTEHALTLYDQGYRRLLPLVPREKRPRFSGWQVYNNRDARLDEIERWARVGRDNGIGLAVGGAVAALDLDHSDWGVAEPVRNLADRIIGETPLVRIGEPHRSLRLYQARPGPVTRTIQKLQIGVYGTTGQVVLYGIHPRTGRQYEWPECSPLDVHADDLPPLTPDTLERFLAEVEAAGIVPAPPEQSSSLKTGALSDGGPLAHFHELRLMEPNARLEDTLAEYMRSATARHPAMVSCVAVLLRAGLDEGKILDVIGDAYLQHFVADGGREIKLRYRKLIAAIRDGERKGFALDLDDLRRRTGQYQWGRLQHA